MSQHLPPFDRALLRLVSSIVPTPHRSDWQRTWHAELWHLHHRRQPANPRLRADLTAGILRDALWLRTDSWRESWSGTAQLCLASLAGLCVAALLVGLAMLGSWPELAAALAVPVVHSLEASPLVLSVALATTVRLHTQPGSKRQWLKRQVFFAHKVLLLMLLAFLVSADAAMPLRLELPNGSMVAQLFGFVLATILALRWAIADQELRCKQCLRLLTAPARVGRPSRNLLEWNGTEAACKRGHGRLSVPEIETSWCQSSRWIAPSEWNQTASRVPNG